MPSMSCEGEIAQGEEALEEHGHLVGRALRRRGDAPVVQQPLTGPSARRGAVVGLVEPDDGLGVAGVDDEEHGTFLFSGGSDVEADVEHRRGVGQAAHGDAVDPRGGVGRDDVERDPTRDLEQRAPGRVGAMPPRRPAPRRGSCCRAGGHRLRRAAPRATWSRRSHSTCTVRAGQSARARATASVIPNRAMWLSLSSTQSDRLPRWLAPPPARTAAFSRLRSPGVVLRVSQMRAGPPAAAASTNARVRVAMPER